MSDYKLYILRCSDETFYTGIARDVDARLSAHASGTRGAKYLRGRTPFELVFRCTAGDRGAALKLEHQVKRLSRVDKQALIDGRLSIEDVYASGSGSGVA